MKGLSLFRRNFLTLFLSSVLLLFSGCVYLAIGGLGALGGYVVSPDTVEGVAAFEQDEMWAAAVEVISIMGLIEESQEAGGLIIGKVNGAKVTINIIPTGPSVTKLKVKARKSFFPKIKVAQNVYIKVMTQLVQ